MSDPIVVAGYARTPMGSFQGSLSSIAAPALGSVAVKAALERSGVEPAAVEQIFMGCVLPAGLGQAPARQAGLGAGLPLSSRATTVNKMCGSGMQAVILGHDAIAAGSADIVVAGGMESMSNAPYLLPRHRQGARIGHDRVVDSMYFDGLEDVYEPGVLMGRFADDAARSHQVGREEQDAYAVESLGRAREAQHSGAFAGEIAPVEVKSRQGSLIVDMDEQPSRGDAARIPTLKPAFAPDGTITAASSSSISDGAAALLLTRGSVADRLGLSVRARIAGHAGVAGEPPQFAVLPAQAIDRLLERIGWRVGDVDLFEVNEAFAVVPMLTMRALTIPHDRMNVHGGACALGHPIGASGARIIVTLIAAMQARGARRGVASLCLGGGEATAVAVEIEPGN